METDTVFYDAHMHTPGSELGGFLIGMEGTPWFDDILHNEEAEALARKNCNYRFFHYVTAAQRREPSGHLFLKYHPRREKYTADEVVESIRLYKPVGVMIDTLNEPYWVPYDYWKVCRTFPNIRFILPHSGGYLVNDFIKICHFQPNVWIDFALTHTLFAKIAKVPLPYVEDAIHYALNSVFRNRVLAGSDIPFFSQEDVIRYYRERGALSMLNENFLSLNTLFEKSVADADAHLER